MNKKIIISIIILLIILVLLTIFLIIKNSNKNIIKTYGNIEIRQVDLSFQVSGVINNVVVEEGDYVKEGQLIATLDDRDYVANYKKALGQKLSSDALKKEDISKYERNNPLCFDGTISKEYCETLLNNKDSSIAKNKEYSANLDFQKNRLDYTKLYAPQKGIISSRVQEKGARVQEGQIIYVMNLTHPVWVRTYIKETDLGNIKYGATARVLTDTIDPKTKKRKEYKGFVGYISPVSEFSPKTVQSEDLRADLVYRIRVYIYETDEYLRQGMPVTIEFSLDDKNDTDKRRKLHRNTKFSQKI